MVLALPASLIHSVAHEFGFHGEETEEGACCLGEVEHLEAAHNHCADAQDYTLPHTPITGTESFSSVERRYLDRIAFTFHIAQSEISLPVNCLSLRGPPRV